MTFSLGARVLVTDSETGLWGETGTVVRLLKRSAHEAWINMDRDLPIDLRNFPKDDPDGRGNHVLLFDDECEPDPSGSAGRLAR